MNWLDTKNLDPPIHPSSKFALKSDGFKTYFFEEVSVITDFSSKIGFDEPPRLVARKNSSEIFSGSDLNFRVQNPRGFHQEKGWDSQVASRSSCKSIVSHNWSAPREKVQLSILQIFFPAQDAGVRHARRGWQAAPMMWGLGILDKNVWKNYTGMHGGMAKSSGIRYFKIPGGRYLQRFSLAPCFVVDAAKIFRQGFII